MSPIYHIVPEAVWQQAGTGPYHAASLPTEGFAHCSYRDQVAPVVQRFYAGQTGLLLLELDPAKLGSELRAEDGGGQLYPHVYGPIARDAVVKVWPLNDWLQSLRDA